MGERSVGRVVCGRGQRVRRRWREREGRGRGRRRGFLRQHVIIIHCLLELADDDDFHLCFSGIVTVFVAVAT